MSNKRKERFMNIPKYNFSFDNYIEEMLNRDDISHSLFIESCYKKIDDLDTFSKNSLTSYEWDSLVRCRSLLKGVPNFLLNHDLINDPIVEKKYRRIQKILSEKSK